jgi:hypothetical protein
VLVKKRIKGNTLEIKEKLSRAIAAKHSNPWLSSDSECPAAGGHARRQEILAEDWTLPLSQPSRLSALDAGVMTLQRIIYTRSNIPMFCRHQNMNPVWYDHR